MQIEYKNGVRRIVRDFTGRRLVRIGIAREVKGDASNTYLTRDMRAPSNHVPAGGKVVTVADELSELNADQLHALAKERGIKVHPRAGADKVRAALKEAEK